MLRLGVLRDAFGFGQDGFAIRPGAGLGTRKRAGERRQIRCAAAAGSEARVDFGKLGIEPRRTLIMLAQRRFELIAARGKVGKSAGQVGEGFFRTGQCRFGAGKPGIDPVEPRTGFAREFAEGLLFARKPGERRFGVGGERAFPNKVRGELLDAAVKFGNPLLGARLFALEGFARDQEPLQAGSGLGFGVAQSRQRRRDLSLLCRG